MDPACLESSRTAEPDPLWPPPQSDLDACCVVTFREGAEGSVHAEMRALSEFPPPLPAGTSIQPPPVPPLPPPLPVRGGPARPSRDDRRLAAAVALYAAACVIVSFAEFGGGPIPLEAGAVEAVALGPEPAASDADPSAQDASGPWPDPLVSLYETRADAARPIKLRFSVVDPWRAAARARPPRPKVGTVAEAAAPQPVRVALASPPAGPTLGAVRWPSRPGTLPPAPIAGTRTEPADPLPQPSPAAARRTPSSPGAVGVSPSTGRLSAVRPAAAPVDRVPAEEEGIRTTLTRFGSAYSRLDAGAARQVWPSVDVRALERAFGDLKSQDLRFDGCSVTVEGARARAACTGRAVYVPRIGNQSPRSTSREWTFELKKADEQWTIASARSS